MRPGATDLTRRLAAAFAAETARRVAAMGRDVVALQGSADPAETQRLLEGLACEAHSLKGAADAAGVAPAHLLADRMEQLFERLRREELEPRAAVCHSVRRALDAILAAAGEPGAAQPLATEVAALAAQLDDPCSGAPPAGPAPRLASGLAGGHGPDEGVTITTARLEALLTAIGELTTATAAIQRGLSDLARLVRDLRPIAPPAAQTRVDGAPADRRRPAVVLLVENSETTRALQKHLLEHAGHEVRAVADGTEAWSLLATDDVHVVVSDILMPGIDGLQLTARIRGDERLGNLPVVLVTATDDPGRREQAREVRADAYVVKGTIEHENLAGIVERLSPG